MVAAGALLSPLSLGPIIAVPGASAGTIPNAQRAAIAEPQPAGVWAATGKVLVSHDVPAEPAGITLQRTWLIFTDPLCTSCLVWEREISDGLLASLLRHGTGGWSTSQKVAAVCNRGDAEQTSHWAIEVGPRPSRP